MPILVLQQLLLQLHCDCNCNLRNKVVAKNESIICASNTVSIHVQYSVFQINLFLISTC